MARRDEVTLVDIAQACRLILEFIRGMDKGGFLKDLRLQEAAERGALVAALREGERDVEAGRTLTHEEMRAKWLGAPTLRESGSMTVPLRGKRSSARRGISRGRLDAS